ncbi:hypothetical protein [Providencia hangzhouensis]|uniref:hypothetical protein n=1 Tax=Providencia hangzhouensis TaxID=3031799 RepID=UPI0034DD77F4
MSDKSESEFESGKIPLVQVTAFSAYDMHIMFPAQFQKPAIGLDITGNFNCKEIPEDGRLIFILSPQTAREMQVVLAGYLNQLTMDNKSQH